MIVVMDTSVLVRLAGSRRGLMLLRHASSHGWQFMTLDYILKEFERTLRHRFGMTKQRAMTTTRSLARLCTLVAPQVSKAMSRDPADDMILGTAIAGQADFLVTEDKDLLVLTTMGNIEIIDLVNFTELLREIS